MPPAYDRTSAVLLLIAKRDTPNRFEFFCVKTRGGVSSSHPSGEETLQIAGARIVLGYGNHSCQLPNFPRWIWHVVPMKEFKRSAENGTVDHRLNSFSCWAPFPPGFEGSDRFYEIFYDWWVRNVATEPKAYELIPNTPKHRYVVLLSDEYAIAEERAPINYHVAGYFPIKDEVPLTYIRFAFMLDSGSLIYNSPVK